MEVRLNGYDNRDNSCINCPVHEQPDGSTLYGCCDDHNRDNGDCRDDRQCDSYFIFCLRPFGSERGIYDCQTLYNGTKVTSVNEDDRSIDFTNEILPRLDLENPFLLPGLTEEYEVSNNSNTVVFYGQKLYTYHACMH